MRARMVVLVGLALLAAVLLSRACQSGPTWDDVQLGSASGNAGLATYCQSTNPPSLDVWMRSNIGGQQNERMSCSCETVAAVLNAIDTCCGTTNGSAGGMAATADSSGSCGTTVFRAVCPDPPSGQVEISATAMINSGGPTTVDNWACSSDNLDDMREAWERCCL